MLYSSYKTFIAEDGDDDIEPVLDFIFEAMHRVEGIVKEAAEEHRKRFEEYALAKVGAAAFTFKEPYLKYELERHQLQFLNMLGRLLKTIERNLFPENKHLHKDYEFFDLEIKAIDYRRPLLPQIEDRIEAEIERLKERLYRALDKRVQEAFGIKRYIWHTQGDERVRGSHAANDGKIFSWDNPPPMGHPGEDYGCRCWAEPILTDPEEYPDAIEEIYPELVIPILGARRIILEGLKRLGRASLRLPKIEPEEEPGDIQTPTPQGTEEDIFKRPEGVPEDWVRKSSNKGDGVKYVDPRNKHTYVRIQKGDPNSSNPLQQRDYVRWQRNGQALDKFGNVVKDGDPYKIHIPLEEFKF